LRLVSFENTLALFENAFWDKHVKIRIKLSLAQIKVGQNFGKIS